MLQNRYEKFISKLIDQTSSKNLKWKAMSLEISIRIKNPELIDRIFMCKNYKKDSSIYLIRFNYPEYSMSGGEKYDVETFKLLVYNENVRIKEIDATEVDPEILHALFKVVEISNEQAQDFFNEFD